jgi:hypothetical protein
MRWTREELWRRVAALPEDVRTTIICDVAWDLFGDLDEDEDEVIDAGRRPDSPDVKNAVGYLREELTRDRAPLTVARVIAAGELELAEGMTFDEVAELACAPMDRACTWDICGEVVFVADDGRHYVGTVEFVIGPANPSYVEEIDKKAEDDDG